MGRARAFVALDGLRGMAALAVVTVHSGRFSDGWGLPTAYLAVDLFFVLSGFVLAHAYEQAFRDGLSPSRFMLQRLIRLYPLYILGIAMGMFVAVLNIQLQGGGTLVIGTWERFFTALPWSLFMLPCPPGVDGTMFPFNFVMWSIFFELIVNVLWAASWRYVNSTKALATIVGLGALGLIASGVAFGTLNVGIRWDTFLGGLARVMYAFPLGILLYRAHYKVKLELPTVPLLLSLVLLFLLPQTLGTEIALGLVILPALVLLTSYARPKGIVAKACTFVGEASYAVYAMHVALYALTYAALQIIGIRAEDYAPWGVAGFMVVVLIAGGMAHRWYDVPVRRWLTRRATLATAPDTTARPA